MNKYLHKFSEDVSEGVRLQGMQVWRPSVPLPMFVGFGLKKAKCDCGRVFKNEQAYREHFIYQAVWMNEGNYIPRLLAKAQSITRQKA